MNERACQWKKSNHFFPLCLPLSTLCLPFPFPSHLSLLSLSRSSPLSIQHLTLLSSLSFFFLLPPSRQSLSERSGEPKLFLNSFGFECRPLCKEQKTEITARSEPTNMERAVARDAGSTLPVNWCRNITARLMGKLPHRCTVC